MFRSRSDQFEALVVPHLDAAYRAALALASNHDVAADLVQSACLKALDRFESFQAGTDFKAWLLRILRNLWIDRLRHDGKVKFVPLDEEFPPAAPPSEEAVGESVAETTLLESFSDQNVLMALKQLPPEQRLALLLVDVEQMDHRQVAEILEVPVGTIKSRTSRARMALKNKLLAHAKDMGFMRR